MFTNQQKIDIRRHVGLPVYGSYSTSSPNTFGYRYNVQYLIEEYRLNNLQPEEEETLINVYLNRCNTLEAAIPLASENLDTSSAAVWVHNPNEVRDRWNLYNTWRQHLCDFLCVKGIAVMMNTRSRVII